MLDSLGEQSFIKRINHHFGRFGRRWQSSVSAPLLLPRNTPSSSPVTTARYTTLTTSTTSYSSSTTHVLGSTSSTIPSLASPGSSPTHTSVSPSAHPSGASESPFSSPSSGPTTVITSFTTTITTPSTFTSLVSTTFTTFGGLMPSTSALPTPNSLLLNSQPICIGDGLDVSAIGLISTLVLPSAVGLIIWLIFSFVRPRFRQVYGAREWFPPQDSRPRPLGTSFWAFLFPHVPLVPAIPSRSDVVNAEAGDDLPSDGQLAQRVLWTCFLIVSGWSVVGLVGALPLYLVDTPCLAHSIPQASFGGLYSTLQDLSLLRLLQVVDSGDASTESLIFSKAAEDGSDISSNTRTRLIVLTAFAIVLMLLPALFKLIKEFTKLANYRRDWLELHCDGIEMGWLSARNAPGFVGWGEKSLKDFIIKSGLSVSLDRNSGIGVSGTMTGIGSGYRSRTQSQRSRTREDAERPLSDDEKARPEIDISSVFSIGDTGELTQLIAERDQILEQLEIAEARYIASFRLSTPEPSVAELPIPPQDDGDIKRQISRPRALAGYTHTRRQRGRRQMTTSTAPISYVAPSSYYKLRGVRGISGGRFASTMGDENSPGNGLSFGETVRSRIVGSRFQEFNRDSVAIGGRLPIGSRVGLDKGELGPLSEGSPPESSQAHAISPSPINEMETETSPLTGSGGPGTSRGVSGIEEDYRSQLRRDGSTPMQETPLGYVDTDGSGTQLRHGPSEFGVEETSNLSHVRRTPQPYPKERRETFPMRARTNETEEIHVPLHLRLQPQGPFVRPLSGLDHNDLGAVYAGIGEWRTKLKQINNEISDAQNDCYNDIADGARIRGWLITGRGVRFLSNVKLIEGRSKADIRWNELQRDSDYSMVTFWAVIAMVAVLLGAGLVAVSGLAVSVAPNVSHYLSFLHPFVVNDNKLGVGLVTSLVPAVAATVFFILAIVTVRHAANFSGAIAISSVQMLTFKATFFILTIIGVMWFTAVGAVVFAMNAFATGINRASNVANGSIYMSACFIAIIITVAIIVPGFLLLQPTRLRKVVALERHAITPRQRFRALYPGVYDPTYAMGCCVLAVVLASTFSLIFPPIGPAVAVLLLLTIIAHRFNIGYVYGRTDATTGGLMQLWLLRRFTTIVTFQPILLGLIFMTRHIFIEGGILVGVGAVTIVATETYTSWKMSVPGMASLNNVTQAALDIFEETATFGLQQGSDSGRTSVASPIQAPRMRTRGSMASVLEMMSLTLAVMPTPQQARGTVPFETETLDDLTATERAARTHPDAPPHLPSLPFADHAEEMSGILYAPELIAPPPIIWLPNDSAGIARSEAYDLQRYHNLRTTLDVRSVDDVPRRSSSSRRRVVS